MKDQAELIYIYDALCGWCYGFSPVMQQLQDRYATDVKFSVLSGGMILGDRVGPIGEVAPYIKTAYRDVEQRTGVTFGQAFLEVLDDGSQVFSSKLPGIAMTAFRMHNRDRTLDFAHHLQWGIYHEGLDLNQPENYRPLLKAFPSVDEAQFMEQLTDELYWRKTQEEFGMVQQFGVRGFPTLLAYDGEKTYRLTSGYRPYEDVAGLVEQVFG